VSELAPVQDGFLHRLWNRRYSFVAVFTVIGISVHITLRYGSPSGADFEEIPLLTVLAVGGVPLTLELLLKLFHGKFGSDLLAGISIVTSVILHEYLAGSLVVLMLSGGEALEAFAVRHASRALEALARRMPSIAHRRTNGQVQDINVSDVRVGNELVVLPHEVSPVDGTVVAGHGAMDESYLTGEPYVLSKTIGSNVLSGAVNGETALTVRADKLPTDSRYAKIVQVMRASEQQRPRMRRLGDQLGALYTPLAIAIACGAWVLAGDPVRFLAVIVVATPCPLLIAIPVAVIGAISLAARRGIIIKNPASLEQISQCRTAIFDKTGTLTYGKPELVDLVTAENMPLERALQLAASLERYSKHPLAAAILEAARANGLTLLEPESISEAPGKGLTGQVSGHEVALTGRKGFSQSNPGQVSQLPTSEGGLECIMIVDSNFAALFRMRDEPRSEGRPLIAHLKPMHAFRRVMIVSGDRDNEVRYLAERVGIRDVHASQSPEQKVEIVRRETAAAKTVYLGDGINDAPALAVATVGIAFGQNSDVSSEAADAVIMDSSLEKFDELLHIGRRMRRIALQSAVGGMILSGGGMAMAATGYLPPVAGALLQEVIDVAAVLNALRMVIPQRRLTDF
jgi:heavy metal translocating P-type ATPase